MQRRTFFRFVGVGALAAAIPGVGAPAPGAPKVRPRSIEAAGLALLFGGIAGRGLTGGYRVARVSELDGGAVTIELTHTDGSVAHVQAFRRSPLSRGLATTGLLDLRLMNGADGGERSTREELGVAVLTLASHLRRVESAALRSRLGADRRASLRGLYTHERRFAMHGGFEDGMRPDASAETA